MRAVATAVALALALGARMQVAGAQDKPPDPAVVDEAKQHFAEGKKHHDAGEYEAAATEYARAYDLYPMPVLVYNIAQVKRLGGHKQEALDHYEKYVALEPTGQGADNAREFIATLRKEIAEGKPVGKPVEKPDEHGGALPPPVERPSVTRGPARNAGRGKRIGGLVVAGFGLVAIGVGVKFGLDARGYSEDTSDIGGVWDPAQESIWDDGEAAQRNAVIATSVGAAAVVTGIVVYTLGSRERRRAETTEIAISPIAVPGGGAGAALWGQF